MAPRRSQYAATEYMATPITNVGKSAASATSQAKIATVSGTAVATAYASGRLRRQRIGAAIATPTSATSTRRTVELGRR